MLTLVYVPGLGDDETVWQSLWPEQALSGIGHLGYVVPGSSDRPWGGESVEDVANDLGMFVAKLSEPVVIVGHSVGGVIGTILAESPPENLLGFVNIEGNLTPADCGISGAAARARDFQQWFDLFINQAPPRYTRALKRADPLAFRAMAEDLVRLSDDMGDRYRTLGIPKLLIHGTNGFPALTQAWVSSALVEVVRVKDAGHWVHEDAPSETAAAIRDFLDGNQLE